MISLIEAIPPMRGTVGKPRRRPLRLYVDRGYDRDKYRHLVRDHGIIPMIARRGAEHGSGLRTIRWPVERSFAWLKGFSAACASAPNAEPMSAKPSSAWPAQSSAYANSFSPDL
ncbi:transposase [Amycolatopsis sp. FDAARGOS 1241]|uniref:transposase n=1 Tax=Amycolatopsis sp. FDAARGOS 1241 TaxID=2778070 RepID=UPI00195089D5|nr:hypothetical protein I6J71_24620 [Amycolatopsis sp. FDAARGOS 1241]